MFHQNLRASSTKMPRSSSETGSSSLHTSSEATTMQSWPSTSKPAGRKQRTSTLMDAPVWGKLPETELELIFARLPLKDIVRLQTLNSHWKLLIRSSFFQQCFDQVSQARSGLLTDVIERPERRRWDFHIFDTPAGEWNHFPLSELPDTISHSIFPIATAGGLVCMSNIHGEWIFVANPVTNVCRKLPQDLYNTLGWTKCRYLAMALMETMDNHHHNARQYTLTLALSRKPWPEPWPKKLNTRTYCGPNLTTPREVEKQASVSYFSFAGYDSATDCWIKFRDNPNNLLRNKLFRLFPSGAALMPSTDTLGNQVLKLIPRPLDVASRFHWMEAPNDSNSQSLAYGVRSVLQSVDVYKLEIADQQLEWKKVASIPTQSTQLVRNCLMICNDKMLILGTCYTNKRVIYNGFLVSMCDLTICTLQDLPDILLPSYLETNCHVGGFTFEIKFDAVP